MGKIRVKTLGVDKFEEQDKKKSKVKKEQKEARKSAKGAHGGERLVAVGPSEEELAKIEVPKEEEAPKVEEKTKKARAKPQRQRSKRYRESLTLVDRSKTYPLSGAIELLKKVTFSTFDGTVELHINVKEKGVTGHLTLPHGSGKVTRVAIANDEVLKEIEQGKIDFDVLLAHPSQMPKLAKVARILGPKGLMPNPKAGTISDAPEKLAEKYKAGQMNFRTEAQAPIIHLVVGKVSMGEKDLLENVQTVLSVIGSEKILNITLKSTMSPGIKLAV